MPPKTAAGKKEKAPAGRSTPQRKQSERPKGATSGKTKKQSKSSSKGRAVSFLPFVTVWLIAAVVLAGLLYWGKSGKTPSPMVTRTDNQAKEKSPQGSSSDRTREKKLAQREPQPHSTPEPSPSTIHPKQIEPQETAARPSSHPTDKLPGVPPRQEGTAKPLGTQYSPALAEVATINERATRPEAESRTTPRPSSPSIRYGEIPEQQKRAPTALPDGTEKLAAVIPHPEEGKPPKTEFPPTLAEVAIVIDDFGQNLDAARRFLEIPIPVTFSVLPFQPHSEEIVQLARNRGHEVILHIPMQPQEYPRNNPGSGALLLAMSSDEIQKQLRSALDAYPGISGINNHMGSRFTESASSMKIVLAELQRRNLYFLDSYTSEKSVGYSLAKELNLPTRKRDIFLDHTRTEKYVRAQLNRLIRQAKIQGVAIAIGHPHDCTYKVLKQEADRFRREGIAVVPSGKLIRSAAPSPGPDR